MRLLIATVSLVAMAGVAFAGEPQKTTAAQQPVVASAQKAPAKMTDQQLGKVIAGQSNDVTLVINNGGNEHCAHSTTGGRGQGSGAATFAYLACAE